jgi:hypothetical protein
MYRGELADEEARANKLRADIAALETKLAAARDVSGKLALEERRSLRRKLRPLGRWWGILLVLFACSLGVMIMADARGIHLESQDPCAWLKGRPIQYVPYKL